MKLVNTFHEKAVALFGRSKVKAVDTAGSSDDDHNDDEDDDDAREELLGATGGHRRRNLDRTGMRIRESEKKIVCLLLHFLYYC